MYADLHFSRFQNYELEVRAHLFSVSIGNGLAFSTGGASLIGSAYGGRRLYLAKKKLELLQKELDRRGLESYKPTKRELLTPMGISLPTMGLGGGIDIVAAHATSTIAAHVVAHHGSHVVHDVMHQPVSFV